MSRFMRAARYVGACLVVLTACFLAAVTNAQVSTYPSIGGGGALSALLSTAGFGYASNVGWLVNGTNPQRFNIYNTYTDSGNYERIALTWVGNIFYISPQAAGTGVTRSGILGGTWSSGQFNAQASDASYFGTASNFWANLYLSRSIQGSKSKGLTEGAATSVARVAVAQTAASNYGGGSVGYTVYATDATDSQSLVGDVRFAMVNKAGTETCTIGEVGTPVLAVSAGGSTLTCTWTCATAAADTVDIQANCTSSLVQTTFTAETRGDMQKPNTWTPQ